MLYIESQRIIVSHEYADPSTNLLANTVSASFTACDPSNPVLNAQVHPFLNPPAFGNDHVLFS